MFLILNPCKPKFQRRTLLPSTIVKRSLVEKAMKRNSILGMMFKANLEEQSDTFLVLHESIIWLGFPGASDVKKFACNPGDPSLIPALGRSPGEGNGIFT